ncbi:hypothetical protein Vadar_009142 [Vaccinium darrowii]|uniref:Uncharacterized protein n=1 Tax=Vaccinium darrowii TaxID=229202 RepID=A0ACB7XQP5_9ERIC|nr:hypothetical protein Vadar_009142 [Vaccinium darrowii]
MERLVEASEQEVKIDFVLGRKCRANVRLKSLSATTPVAFKVQTSSPNKFLVNPPSGLIQPLSYATFQVVLKPQSQLPAIFPRSASDPFLVKTALATAEKTKKSQSDKSTKEWSTNPPWIITLAFLIRFHLVDEDYCSARSNGRSTNEYARRIIATLSRFIQNKTPALD